jgi:steroid 5-alpha reductase family enzyme
MILGSALYLVGLMIETVADGQKWFFKKQRQHQPNTTTSSFCNVGLWNYSQHPNFVGNFLLWIGIFVLNIDGLVDRIPKSIVSDWPTMTLMRRLLWRLWMVRKLLLASLSPVFLWTLFAGQAKGTITSAKALADQKYGDDPAYLEYIESTPMMFPIPNLLTRLANGRNGKSKSQEL